MAEKIKNPQQQFEDNLSAWEGLYSLRRNTDNPVMKAFYSFQARRFEANVLRPSMVDAEMAVPEDGQARSGEIPLHFVQDSNVSAERI